MAEFASQKRQELLLMPKHLFQGCERSIDARSSRAVPCEQVHTTALCLVAGAIADFSSLLLDLLATKAGSILASASAPCESYRGYCWAYLLVGIVMGIFIGPILESICLTNRLWSHLLSRCQSYLDTADIDVQARRVPVSSSRQLPKIV